MQSSITKGIIAKDEKTKPIVLNLTRLRNLSNVFNGIELQINLTL